MSDIDKVFAELDTGLRKFKREWGIEFQERVQRRTPVVTGNLQKSWGFTEKAKDVEIWNLADYASYVEYGTPHQAPQAMMRTTLEEKEQISEVAAQRAGLKK
jgi:HK97 gp10 family phage protein